MNHEEQKLQMQCVAWFRAQYPQYAMLMTHPINEGHRGTAKIGGIHKAEGTQAGVPDLLFFMPTYSAPLGFGCGNQREMIQDLPYKMLYGLGIEFKTPKGKQSQEQKDFEKMFKAAGYEYWIIRSFDEFKDMITLWISCAIAEDRRIIAAAHVEIVQAAEQREKEKFYKIIGK